MSEEQRQKGILHLCMHADQCPSDTTELLEQLHRWCESLSWSLYPGSYDSMKFYQLPLWTQYSKEHPLADTRFLLMETLLMEGTITSKNFLHMRDKTPNFDRDCPNPLDDFATKWDRDNNTTYLVPCKAILDALYPLPPMGVGRALWDPYMQNMFQAINNAITAYATASTVDIASVVLPDGIAQELPRRS